MRPHLVKEIENPITKQTRLTVPHESARITTVTQADLDFVKRAMVNVTSNPSGTAYQPFRDAAYLVGGKTGTAQVFSLQGQKYRGGALAERLRDHSLFIAFAPADHPQIAVAVIVENGGWGASVAGPMVRRVLDYYLLQRRKPGVLAAAVATAASATQEASVPIIGQPETQRAALPVKVAPGFKALPLPVLPASAATAASDPAASAPEPATAAPAASASPPAASASAPPIVKNGRRAPAPKAPAAPAADTLAPAREHRTQPASGATPTPPAAPGSDD